MKYDDPRGFSITDFDKSFSEFLVKEALKADAEETQKAYESEMEKKKAAHLALVWNGEGLPPVGASVEVKNLDCASVLPRSIEDWKDGDKIECIAHCVMRGGEHVSPVFFNKRVIQFSSLRKDCYCPIRTPEQIAAEERENDIAEAMKVMAVSGVHTSAEACLRIATAYVDAGYRKHEQK